MKRLVSTALIAWPTFEVIDNNGNYSYPVHKITSLQWSAISLAFIDKLSELREQ